MSEQASDSRSRNLVIGIGIAIVAIIAIVILARLIGGGQPEAAPTGTPAPIPTSGPGDDSWERIVQAGKIRVGTSADYPPFEYYTDSFELDGFDIALMEAIGQQLGYPVEFNDFAFDGLAGALQINQIDAAIAAISVTPTREALYAFSNVYYVGGDGALARSDSTIQITTGADLIPYKVGVQRGTVYEQWIRDNLVVPGLMPAGNLYEYTSADDAVRDLKESRIDVVVMDLQPAEEAVASGGVKLAGQQLNNQRFAIGMKKGATALQLRINQALTELQNQGRIAALAQQYLNMPTLPPVEPPTSATPTPGPTPTPIPCVDAMQWVADLSYNDNNMTNPPVMQPGQPFTKGWRVKNVGSCVWGTGYRLAFVGGNSPYSSMGGQPVLVSGQVASGATYDFMVNLVAPPYPGTYQAFWQMFNAQNVAFGEKVWVGITVPGAPTPTPAPTQTPAPNVQFSANPTSVQQGQCTTFTWSATNVKAVYFYAEGEDWTTHPVAGQGSSVQCPQQTTTYYLRVVNPDNSVTLRQITINVTPVASAPKITQFVANPPQITLGQCVTVQWQVQGSVTKVALFINGNVLWDGAPVSGSMQNCPQAAGTVEYRLDATGPGGTSRAQDYVTVVLPATATPVPTPVPQQPAIDSFAVVPNQISAGQCVQISWATSGGTSRVQIKRDTAVLLDNAPLSGSLSDCPPNAGPVAYSIVAQNNANQSVSRTETIMVYAAGQPPQNPLAGTSWAVTSVRGQPMLPGSLTTMVFEANGELSGSAGCNTYGAQYSLNGQAISISGFITSQLICADPPGIMEQEQSFLNALGSAASYQRTDTQLILRDSSGAEVVRAALQ